MLCSWWGTLVQAYCSFRSVFSHCSQASSSPLLFTSDLTGHAASEDKPATFLSQFRGEVQRTKQNTSKKTEKKLAAFLQVMKNSLLKRDKESSWALPELEALWTNRTGLKGTPSAFVSVCVCAEHSVLFIAQQLQLVLVLREQSLESQVLADDRQHLTQQVSLPQTLKTNQRIWFAELTTKKKKSCAWATYATVNSIISH